MVSGGKYSFKCSLELVVSNTMNVPHSSMQGHRISWSRTKYIAGSTPTIYNRWPTVQPSSYSRNLKMRSKPQANNLIENMNSTQSAQKKRSFASQAIGPIYTYRDRERPRPEASFWPLFNFLLSLRYVLRLWVELKGTELIYCDGLCLVSENTTFYISIPSDCNATKSIDLCRISHPPS